MLVTATGLRLGEKFDFELEFDRRGQHDIIAEDFLFLESPKFSGALLASFGNVKTLMTYIAFKL